MNDHSKTEKQKPSFRVLIATGGTGGHFYPALTVAYSIRKRGGEAIFAVGGQQAAEHRERAEYERFRAFALTTPRGPTGLTKVPVFAFKFMKGLLGSFFLLLRCRPNCVMGMGSFASIPLCLAAVIGRYPLVLHEANSLVGQANRFLSRFADILMYSLPLNNKESIRCSTFPAGMPVRRELVDSAEKNNFGDSISIGNEWGLHPELPTVLAFGGSQGAQFINKIIPEAMERIETAYTQFQLIHLTGTENNKELQEKYDALGLRARVATKERAMEKCYEKADIAFCRAGASTISELALFGIPAVLIPLPTSKDGHQQANAQVMDSQHAAVCRTQDDFTSEVCAAYVRNWLQQPEEWKTLGRNLQAFARPDAPETIAQILEKYRIQ